MKRLDRLNAILTQLQSKRIVKSSEIAERFNISQRTVYRDIRALEESGIPIGAEAGIGYFLMENYQLPPVMFTNEEASALLLGEKLVDKMSDEEMRKHYHSAAYKIKAILKPSEKDYLEKLHERVSVFNWANWGHKYKQLHLHEIQQALVNKQVLKITYTANYSNQTTEREIEPIGLCNYSSRWHLFAWCNFRNDYRDFRLDRIKELRITDKNYKGKQHITVEEFMNRMNPISDDANILLSIPTDRKRYIEDSKYFYGFLEEEEKGDRTFMKFSNNELHGFAIWLISTRSLAKIDEPTELQEILNGIIKELCSNGSH